MFGPIFGGNPNHHVSVLLLQVLDPERGLFPLWVGLSAESVWDLHILPCPVLQVIAVLNEAGQPPPLPVVQTALGL